MQIILAHSILLNNGWHENMLLSYDAGYITGLEKYAGKQVFDREADVIVTGMPNLHSHAFQHAMADFAEKRGTITGSFWSWRREMYRLALSMTPEQVEAAASRPLCGNA